MKFKLNNSVSFYILDLPLTIITCVHMHSMCTCTAEFGQVCLYSRECVGGGEIILSTYQNLG